MRESGRGSDPDSAARFLDRVRLRSGLLIERAPDQFAFAHLSFQEFFAARFLAEWITSDEWLVGEGIPPGTTPAALRLHGEGPRWREVMAFAFELLAGLKPMRKKKVREAVFGPGWEAIPARGQGGGTIIELLAWLAADPHVGWDSETREQWPTVASGGASPSGSKRTYQTG